MIQSSTFKKLTAAFRPGEISNVFPVAMGALFNQKSTAFVTARLPQGWQRGWKSAVVGLGLAGVSGFTPKYGARLMVGGIARVILDFAAPLLARLQSATEVSVVAPPMSPVSVTAGVKGWHEDGDYDEPALSDLPLVDSPENDSMSEAGVEE